MKYHGPTTATVDIRLPEQSHPYLFLSEQELARMRMLSREPGTHQHAFLESRMAEAEGWLGGEGPVLELCAHAGFQVRDLGLLFALTDDQRYAAAAGRILLRQAEMYARRPAGDLFKVEASTLDESRWLATLCGGYDLVCMAGLLDDRQRRHIEEDLLRASARLLVTGPGDEEVHRVGGGICNYRVVENSAVLAAGCLLRDVDLVQFALNSPRGFFRHLEEGVLDDGGWWEGSPGYHVGMIHSFTAMAEAAWHSGIHLYEHPKLRDMFRWAMGLALPDGTLPAINDAPFGLTAQHAALGRLAALHYLRTGDRSLLPVLAWAPLEDVQGDAARRTVWLDAFTLWIEPTWPCVERPKRRSLLLPSSGKAVLRTDPPAPDIDVMLDYGPHGGYHGHYDRCQIVVHANGRQQAPDPGIGGYGHPLAHGWYRTSLAHNSVVVNRRNRPPCAGHLHLFATSPRFKVADASPQREREENWGDQQERRIVALVDEAFLLDIYRYGWIDIWGGRGPRDWVYHNVGTLHIDETEEADGPMEPLAGPLGETDGYQYLTNVRVATPSGPTWRCAFCQEAQGVALTMLNFEGLQIIAADGPGPGDKARNEPGTMPMILARATSNGPVTWKSVIEPFRDSPAITSVAEVPVERSGGDVVREEGLGLRVERGEDVHHVLVGYNWGFRACEDMRFDAQLAYVRYGVRSNPDADMPQYAFVALGSRFERGAFCLQTDRLATLYLQQLAPERYELGNVGREAVRVELTGRPWAGRAVQRLAADGSALGCEAVSRVGDALCFTAEAGGRYVLLAALPRR